MYRWFLAWDDWWFMPVCFTTPWNQEGSWRRNTSNSSCSTPPHPPHRHARKQKSLNNILSEIVSPHRNWWVLRRTVWCRRGGCMRGGWWWSPCRTTWTSSCRSRSGSPGSNTHLQWTHSQPWSWSSSSAKFKFSSGPYQAASWNFIHIHMWAMDII